MDNVEVDGSDLFPRHFKCMPRVYRQKLHVYVLKAPYTLSVKLSDFFV